MSSNVVNLSKGGVVNLSKHTPGLKSVMVGLGWDPARPSAGGFFKKMFGGETPSSTIDCDACAVLLKNGKLRSDNDVVYFGNLKHSSGAVVHKGDNLTGDGDGDDEEIDIFLSKIPADYDGVVLFVNIYDARNKHQNFGQISNSFIRLVNTDTGAEICRYDISQSSEYDKATAVIFGELTKKNGEWEFKALGEASSGSVSEVARKYR